MAPFNITQAGSTVACHSTLWRAQCAAYEKQSTLETTTLAHTPPDPRLRPHFLQTTPAAAMNATPTASSASSRTCSCLRTLASWRPSAPWSTSQPLRRFYFSRASCCSKNVFACCPRGTTWPWCLDFSPRPVVRLHRSLH